MTQHHYVNVIYLDDENRSIAGSVEGSVSGHASKLMNV